MLFAENGTTATHRHWLQGDVYDFKAQPMVIVLLLQAAVNERKIRFNSSKSDLYLMGNVRSDVLFEQIGKSVSKNTCCMSTNTEQ